MSSGRLFNKGTYTKYGTMELKKDLIPDTMRCIELIKSSGLSEKYAAFSAVFAGFFWGIAAVSEYACKKFQLSPHDAQFIHSTINDLNCANPANPMHRYSEYEMILGKERLLDDLVKMLQAIIVHQQGPRLSRA